MPIYRYSCLNCNKTYEKYKKIEERDNEQCEGCGEKATRAVSATAKPVIMNYYSESIGAHITGPAQRSRIMKEKHLEDV